MPLGVRSLKKRYQPSKATRSWELTIVNQRIRIKTVLQGSSSLQLEFAAEASLDLQAYLG